jgi:subtilisin family serine protease
MSEVYDKYAIISQKEVNINKIDYYMQKDTSNDSTIIRDYYPDRAIEKEFYFTNDRISLYNLTQDEANKILSNPDIFEVERYIPYDSFFESGSDVIITTSSIQSGIFSANLTDTNDYAPYTYIASNSIWNTQSPNINWGLRFHTQYTESVNWEEMFSYDSSTQTITTSSTDYTYNIDGTGVDLVIVDTGVQPHPEFFNKDNTISRLKQINWFQYIQNANPGWRSQPVNFYTLITTSHGTHCASIAAGKYNGWAKNADIYSFRIYGSGNGTIEEACIAIKEFHLSKSINPETGFKRPTIVNFSSGGAANLLNFSSNFVSGTSVTNITQIYYKGISQNLTGNKNIPGLNYNIRIQISGSGKFKCQIPYYSALYNTLIEQLTDAGVIFVKAAGNNSSIITKNNTDLWDSYVIRDANLYAGSTLVAPSGSPVYTNRSDFHSEDTIIVGSIAPWPVWRGNLVSSSYTYNIMGWYSNIYNLPYPPSNRYWTLDPSWFVDAPADYNDRQAIGSGSLFIGWDNLRVSASICPSEFTTVGPAVDIFAAGSYIIAAWSRFGTTQNTLKNFKIYDPLYNPNNYPPTNPPLSVNENFRWNSGTSMAAPQVAGVACLYFQMNPGATAKQFKQFLSASAIKTPQMLVFDEDSLSRYDYSGSAPTPSNQRYRSYGGFGLINDVPFYNVPLSLNGASPLVLHWPYFNPNKARISSIQLTKT